MLAMEVSKVQKISFFHPNFYTYISRKIPYLVSQSPDFPPLVLSKFLFSDGTKNQYDEIMFGIIYSMATLLLQRKYISTSMMHERIIKLVLVMRRMLMLDKDSSSSCLVPDTILSSACLFLIWIPEIKRKYIFAFSGNLI